MVAACQIAFKNMKSQSTKRTYKRVPEITTHHICEEREVSIINEAMNSNGGPIIQFIILTQLITTKKIMD